MMLLYQKREPTNMMRPNPNPPQAQAVAREEKKEEKSMPKPMCLTSLTNVRYASLSIHTDKKSLILTSPDKARLKHLSNEVRQSFSGISTKNGGELISGPYRDAAIFIEELAKKHAMILRVEDVLKESHVAFYLTNQKNRGMSTQTKKELDVLINEFAKDLGCTPPPVIKDPQYSHASQAHYVPMLASGETLAQFIEWMKAKHPLSLISENVALIQRILKDKAVNIEKNPVANPYSHFQPAPAASHGHGVKRKGDDAGLESQPEASKRANIQRGPL